MTAEINATVAPPRPESRVRNVTVVYLVGGVLTAIVALVTMFALIVPLIGKINDSNEARKRAEAKTREYVEERLALEDMRDKIAAQYDAIEAFTQRFPNSAEQDSLYRDLQNSSIFATVRIKGISTDYPQLLADGSFDSGKVIKPEQIIIGGVESLPGADDSEVAGSVPGVDENNDSDVRESDTDIFPLGTVPLALSGELDGSVAYVDDVGTVYVASPHLGYYSYGGDTGRERLSMAVVHNSTVSGLLSSYFADNAGAGTAGWPTVFRPDYGTPPYVGVPNVESLNAEDLVSLYPLATAGNHVQVPDAWSANNGFVRLPDVSRSAWLINEISNSPGRAILIRFVSGSGNSIAIVGQQFIVRELPPLPESIFGDLIKKTKPDVSVSPTPGPVIPTFTPEPEPTFTPSLSASVVPSPSPGPVTPSPSAGN